MGYILLTVIVDQGFANAVMAEARKAGARGGTIMVARGTGKEADVKLFGIPLVPEKEMLFIVAPQDKVDSIASSIQTVPQLSQPGGGVAYIIQVDSFIPLGATLC